VTHATTTKLSRLQYNLLRDLVQSPRGGEYIKPNYRPALKLQELGFIESSLRPQSGDRPGDWWQPTMAGKSYLEQLDAGRK
jgi:hypothetical protein